MSIWTLPIVVLAAGLGAGAEAAAIARQTEVSVSGALQVLNENDTAFTESFVNIPLAAEVTYHLTPIWAVAGELSWIIPVDQEVKAGTSSFEDRKSPDILAYQANVVAKLPLASAWTPYMTGGLGAMTFLSNEDADRLPQLPEDETAFALNFGGGASLGRSERTGRCGRTSASSWRSLRTPPPDCPPAATRIRCGWSGPRSG